MHDIGQRARLWAGQGRDGGGRSDSPRIGRRPLSVVHIIEGLGPGGAERVLYTYLKHLQAAPFSHTIVTVFPGADHWAQPIQDLGVQVISLDCRGYGDMPVGIARLSAWLRRQQPDLVHTHLWAANVVGRIAGRLARIPVMSSIHNPDYEPEALNDGSPGRCLKRRLARLLDGWTANLACKRLIAVSEYVRQSTHRRLGFPLERIDLLYNPIDLDHLLAPPIRGRADLLRGWSLPEGSHLLLSVARLSPQKGLLYAIRALPAILMQFPAVQLLSAGGTADQEWVARLRAEAKRLGVAERLHILGPRRDIPDLLQASDLFLFPSLHEGLGVALIEAMAVGCACVAARTGPVPEVTHHGVDGWLVRPGDSEDLAGAVCALLADSTRRRRLGAAAAQAVSQRFDPEKAAQRLGAIYEGMVARS